MYHKVITVGRLGRDPEMRYTPKGDAVTSFSIATDRQYKDGSGATVKETVWFRVSAWGKLAETCNQYLKKGKMVLVEGRLIADPASGGPRVFQKSDGSQGASFEINASEVRFLSSQGENEQRAPDDDDVPF